MEFNSAYLWLIPVIFILATGIFSAYLWLKIRRVSPEYRWHAIWAFIRFFIAVRAPEIGLGVKRGDRVVYPRIRAIYPVPNGYLLAVKAKEISSWQNTAKTEILARKLFKKSFSFQVVFSHSRLKSRDTLGIIVTPIKPVEFGRVGSITGESELTIGASYNTGKDVSFDYFSAGHTLVSGLSGSGKSVLITGLVENAEKCPEIKVCGIDSTGLVLRENSDFSWAGEALENAVIVAENLVAEMRRRIRFLRENQFQKIEPSAEIPLLLVVLEELSNTLRNLESWDKQNGLKPAERLAPRFSKAIEILYAESRKAGFLLLAVTQKPDLSSLPAGVRENSRTFLTFQQEENSLKLVLSAENWGLAEQLKSMEKTGAFLYQKPGKMPELCQGDYFI